MIVIKRTFCTILVVVGVEGICISVEICHSVSVGSDRDLLKWGYIVCRSEIP